MGQGTPLHRRSRVSTRMVAVFLLCMGVPMSVLAAITVVRTWKELSDTALQRLHHESRTTNQEALARLDRLANALVALTDMAGRNSTVALSGGQVSRVLPVSPANLSIRTAAGNTVDVAGRARVSLSNRDRQQLSDWGRLIKAEDGQLLLVVSGTEPDTFAVMSLDERWLFGLDELDQLPPESSACVFAPGRPAQCSSDSVPDDVAADGPVESGPVTLMTALGPQFAWASTLSLDAQYGAREWRVLLMRPTRVIRAPILRFVQDFLLTTLVAALLVAWVSLRQVHRQLRPLESLTSATDRLTQQDFEHPVVVTSGDEFEVLGNAFNTMAAKLREQFADLEAFNIGTLTTLARAIDAKSPWTAGHSERVTASALRIAAALELPAAEVDQLRRGGLVHDIGKIATPPEILDKPARLTPEEERIMQLHPEQGVHILEPIAAFRPVLPIVGQHHERWDGTGYPKRLAGTEIALTARVLAVADVYDALRSDRPYRAGMPHARVVAIISEGAGPHFDPSVVSAFLKCEAEIDRSQVTRALSA